MLRDINRKRRRVKNERHRGGEVTIVAITVQEVIEGAFQLVTA